LLLGMLIASVASLVMILIPGSALGRLVIPQDDSSNAVLLSKAQDEITETIEQIQTARAELGLPRLTVSVPPGEVANISEAVGAVNDEIGRLNDRNNAFVEGGFGRLAELEIEVKTVRDAITGLLQNDARSNAWRLDPDLSESREIFDQAPSAAATSISAVAWKGEVERKLQDYVTALKGACRRLEAWRPPGGGGVLGGQSSSSSSAPACPA
jgi:hypothetical protein